jgi:RNA recognition motif-containing protein
LHAWVPGQPGFTRRRAKAPIARGPVRNVEKIGRVDDAVVVIDRDTGDSRGFGFVTMTDRKDAGEAIRQLNGAQLEGRTLVVRQAEERRPGGGGGGGGGRRRR